MRTDATVGRIAPRPRPEGRGGAGGQGHGRGPAAQLLVEPVVGVAQQLAQRAVTHGDLDGRAEVAVDEGVEPVAPLTVHRHQVEVGQVQGRVGLGRVEARRQVEGERALDAGDRHGRRMAMTWAWGWACRVVVMSFPLLVVDVGRFAQAARPRPPAPVVPGRCSL